MIFYSILLPNPQISCHPPPLFFWKSKSLYSGIVIFENTTYHVNSVMNTTGLENCEVDVRGTLLWSKDIDYWLNHSLPVGYQNQSSAWFFGGNNVHLYGNGYGTLDGNGQVSPHISNIKHLNNQLTSQPDMVRFRR